MHAVLMAATVRAAPLPVSVARRDADGVTLKVASGTLKPQVFSSRVVRVVN